MSEATDVVDAQIEAYQARDVERFLSHYADDVSVVLFDGTPMFPDKEAMRQATGSCSLTARTCTSPSPTGWRAANS
jgi:hypothetical protein